MARRPCADRMPRRDGPAAEALPRVPRSSGLLSAEEGDLPGDAGAGGAAGCGSRPRPQLGDIEDSESWLSERNIAELVSGILVDVSVATLRRAEDLRAAVHSLEERMDREPDTVEVEEILDIRSELLTLGVVVSRCISILIRCTGAFYSQAQHFQSNQPA